MQERIRSVVEARKPGFRLPFLQLRTRLRVIRHPQPSDWHEEDDGQDLLDNLLVDQSFCNLRDELLRLSSLSQDEKNREYIRHCFAGRVFQMLAETQLGGSLTSDVHMASLEERLELYSLVYSNPDPPKVVNHPFGEVTLKNEVFPDVLILKEGKAQAVGEATLSRDPMYFPLKYYAFRAAKKAHPWVFEQARLLFVTPKHFVAKELLELAGKFTDMSVVQLPFTHKQFQQFITTSTSQIDEATANSLEE